ncbi:hypothetical protein SAMN05192534_10285 [Alteribacillus persepolensis]|uniref:DUF1731 domain-containing protein n=1 Tax=Alteribacillus persepolensis TaxID=568899 RepID=A0A1G8AAG2_9BACI|nr:hypothetical protein SAMN05192534_10285 [Alteribacillus persepolensis]
MKVGIIVLKKIVLAGGSGRIGQSLAAFLINKGFSVTVLTRGHTRVEEGVRYVHWDARTLGEWKKELDGSYALVNLTGKSIYCIHTERNKKEMIRSRYYSVRVLQKALETCEQPPQAFVQAGSIAVYGDTHHMCIEDSPHGEGFLVKMCELWEKAFFAVSLANTRQVMLRMGTVLQTEGGTLKMLEQLVNYRVGGKIGSGMQYISWIHIDDVHKLFLRAIEDQSMGGIYNAVSPQPVTNKLFMEKLRKAMRKSWGIQVPAPIASLGSYLLAGIEPDLFLKSQNALPYKLIDEGYTFQFNHLEAALSDLIKK